ncbi:hypothetical protein D9619_001447 [Psilocybe cf. subviscida]|uniref:PH domain-containing protein n=1 Tax=Psilocybe cf. subviscida TaxID=2480587 RepID=A0A8H5F2Z7_9AGAR|nr:hypothetical protein D9619_001447 [Psilocybe cf. subviscida]
MIGPRSMGAGAYASRSSAAGAHNTLQPGEYANDTFRTVDAYGGIVEAPLTPAQRLIERYERMNTPPPQTPPKNAAMKSTRHRQILSESEMDKRQRHSRHHVLGPPSRATTRKEPSPIRQSLRNLLSVLKKGAGGISKRKSDDRLALPSGSHGQQNYDDVEASQVNANTLTEPRRKMAGQLLYLTRDTPVVSPGVPGLLIWTSCSVTLECNKLVVSSFANDMQLLVHEVSLLRCTDIRSVPASQLSEAEAALLEAMPGGNKVHVFEIIFKGKPKEKFAAKSVRERAGWISAIWDGILPSKDDEARANTLVSQKPATRITEDTIVIAPEVTTTQHAIQIESPRPKPLPQSSPLLSPSYSDRSLPPLPPATPVPQVTAPLSIPDKPKNPQNLHLDLSDLQNPISPSIYPVTFATASSAASTPSGGAHDATTPETNPQRLRVETGSLISPSIYPPSARRLSAFSGGSLTPGALPTPGGGPTTPRSCPNSPSIANLSQLSVVRQRLAQIERNHSELSRENSLAVAARSRPSTPMKSPLSATSRWSRREAVFLNTPTRFTDSPLPMSPVGSAKVAEATRKATRASIAAADEKTLTRDKRPKAETKEMAAGDKSSKPKPKSTEDDVAQLSKEVAGIKNVLGGESGRPTIHQMVLGIEQRANSEKKSLRGIQDTLAAIEKRVNEVAVAVTANSSSTSDASGTRGGAGSSSTQTQDQQENIIRALKEVRDQLSTEFPALATKLKGMQDAQEKGLSIERNMGSASNNAEAVTAPDLQAILNKLDEIKSLFSSQQGRGDEPTTLQDSEMAQKRVETILTLVQEDSNKQALLAQQQADSVRYLNELNTWLEAFVNNGTSQIQGIAMNVDRLCKELGQDDSQQSLVTDIRQLISGMKARDQNFAALQAAVHSLLEVLTSTQTQRGADFQAIAGLIDRQRHDQEVMFRAFTAEISGEIKGERLRFVEAMKEATAINVQTHVEHFKQELGREVMAMTEEVGRLHREKQNVENQISDLFSFYTKQKQADMFQRMFRCIQGKCMIEAGAQGPVYLAPSIV